MIEEILKLKKRKKIVILAHNYQIPQIQDIADFVGDSLELARRAKETKAEIIVFCGVKFMAETAKILSPEKKVLIPEIDAGCPLADMADYDEVIEIKNRYPDAWVVSYVNTNAEIKAISDVCCTSGNAEKVVRNIPAKRVIFLPDKNLCWYVKKKIPEKEIGMLKRIKNSNSRKFIIGTEEGIIHRLKKENPEKEFYSLGGCKICTDMKKITVEKLYYSLKREKFEISLPEEIIEKARSSLERMLEYV